MKWSISLVISLVAVIVFSAVAGMAEEVANPYLGDNAVKCGMCHKTQVAAWKEWPMAKAWDKLSAEEQKKDECIKCHVTGFGKPGGWVSFEKTPKLVGVQCEACHGPGTLHLKAPLADKEKKKATVVMPAEKDCTECHKKEGNPNFKEFVFKDAVAKLADHKNKPAAAGEDEKAEEKVNAYVGDAAKKCAMCHKAQVAAWKEWKLAKSWDSLTAEDQKNEACIKCHVTGYGKPGGWVSFEKTPNLVGIQCEACHGPAGDHMAVPLADKEKKKATMAKADEATCLECHKKEGNPNFKEFVYKDALTAISDHLPKK